MNENRKLINALLVSTMMLSGLALDVSAADGDNVHRIGGKDRVETSINVSNVAYTGKTDAVVVAGWDGQPDALTGTLLASAKDAPLLLVSNKDGDIADVKAEIARLGAKTVYLLGDKSVISDKAADALGKDLVIKRVAGADRFDTAVAVAKEVGSTTGHAFIAVDGRSGELADALAAGPASGKKNSPILLTSKNTLPEQTRKALKELSITSATIVGGTSAVDNAVKTALEAEGVTVDRVNGDNRWETAEAVANTYFSDSEKVIVANDGRVSYADALVGGYLGAKEHTPILLTLPGKLNTPTKNFLGSNASFAYILGQEKVVSKAAETEVQTLVDDNTEDLAVESVSAIDANTISVTFDNEEVVEIELEEALVHGQTEVTFVYEEVEYTAELTEAYVDPAVVEAEELAAAKTDAATALETYVDATEYETNAEALAAAIAEGKAAVEAAETTEEVEAAVAVAQEAIDAIETDAEIVAREEAEAAEELAAAKEEAIEELKEAGITSDFYFDLINKGKTIEGVEALKNEILQTVAVQAATEAVATAEETRTQEDVDAAQALVEELIASDAKEALEDRLAAVQAEIDLVEATEAVEAYEAKVKSAANVEVLVENKELLNEVSEMKTPAFNKVQKVAGEEKDALLERLDVAHDRVIAATVVRALQDATEDLTEDNLAWAKNRLSSANRVPRLVGDEATKDALMALVEVEEAKINELVAVIDAVEAAEENQTEADVNTARALVEALDEGEVQEGFEARLVKVEEAIEAVAAVKDASSEIALHEALSNELFEGYNDALIADYLAGVRTNLVTVEDVNEFIKDINKSVEEKEEEKAEEEAVAAFRAELLAEGKKRNLSFFNYLDGIYDNVEKDDDYVALYKIALFTENVEDVVDGINKSVDVAEAINLVNATKVVDALTDENALAEDVEQKDIDAAQALVNLLTGTIEDGEAEDYNEDKKDLQDKVDIAQVLLDAAEELAAAKEEAIEELKEAGITSDFYFDLINKGKTIEGVEALKNEILQTVAVQAATEAVATAEETRTQEDVDAAQALVEELIASDAKEALEDRLAVVQAEIDLTEATAAVEALTDEEGNLIADQAAITAASELVEALPADVDQATDKADLQSLINAAQELLDVAVINAAIKGNNAAELQKIIVKADVSEYTALSRAQRNELVQDMIDEALAADEYVPVASTNTFETTTVTAAVTAYTNKINAVNTPDPDNKGAMQTALDSAYETFKGLGPVDKLDVAEEMYNKVKAEGFVEFTTLAQIREAVDAVMVDLGL